MLSYFAARIVGTSYRRHDGSAYPVIASEAKQSISHRAYGVVWIASAYALRATADKSSLSLLAMTVFLQDAAPTTPVLLLRQSERFDHLALGLGDFDDELLVVLGVLVVRHHVELGECRD